MKVEIHIGDARLRRLLALKRKQIETLERQNMRVHEDFRRAARRLLSADNLAYDNNIGPGANIDRFIARRYPQYDLPDTSQDTPLDLGG